MCLNCNVFLLLMQLDNQKNNLLFRKWYKVISFEYGNLIKNQGPWWIFEQIHILEIAIGC
jgi:hypothetical protein